MTEEQLKSIAKFFMENGKRKLTAVEKEAIKTAIDKSTSLDELLQVAFASLFFDINR